MPRSGESGEVMTAPLILRRAQHRSRSGTAAFVRPRTSLESNQPSRHVARAVVALSGTHESRAPVAVESSSISVSSETTGRKG